MKGVKIQLLPFKLIKEGDIFAYDGPILSHFKSDDSKDYFMFWVDNDKIYNRWLLFHVSQENIKQYFNAAISLKELVFYNQKDFVYFIDIDDNIDYKNIIRIAVKDFPIEYAPGEKSYFNEKIAQPYALKLAEIYKQIKFKPTEY